MAPCTEVLVLHLKPEVAASVDTDETYVGLMKLVKEQEGCERLFYGHSKEDHNKYYWIIDWTTLADHERLMKLENYPDLVKQIKSYTTTDGMELLHFNFAPSSPHQLITAETPLLEVLTIDLKSGTSESKVNNALDPFSAAMAKQGVKSTRGTAIENSNRVVAFVAWASIEAHEDAKKTDAFTSSAGAVREIWEKATVEHVHLKELKLD